MCLCPSKLAQQRGTVESVRQVLEGVSHNIIRHFDPAKQAVMRVQSVERQRDCLFIKVTCLRAISNAGKACVCESVCDNGACLAGSTGQVQRW